MRKRTAWVLASLLLVAAAWVFLSSRRRFVPEPVPAAASGARARNGVAAPGAARSRAAPAAPNTVVEGVLIGEVAVEKKIVCPFEDVHVRVSPAEDAENVRFNIDGEFGEQFIVKGRTPGDRVFWIVASDGKLERDFRSINLQILPEDDPKCSTKPVAALEATPDPRNPDAYVFNVRGVTGLDEIKSCEWSFGDDATQTTSGARARHSYAKRPQDAESSSYLITAWVTDSRKRHAWARATVTLWNRYFQSRKYTGDRPLPVAYERFLQPGARFPVKIRNIEAQPVVFENAVVTPKSCRNGEAMQDEELPAREVLDGERLAPGEEAQSTIALSSRWLGSDVCRVQVTLMGDTDPPSRGMSRGVDQPPNKLVTAEFEFEVRRPLTEQEGGSAEMASRPVTDPELQEQLLAAMRRSGKNHVTSGDLESQSATP